MKRQALFGLAAAIATMGFLPSAASAQEAPTQARVKVNDLDLTTNRDRAAADKRLDSSARLACPQAGPDLRSKLDADACRKDLVTHGRSQIADAAAAQENARMLAARRARMAAAHASKRHAARHATSKRHHAVKHSAKRTTKAHHATAKSHHKTVTHKTVVHHKTTVHKKG